jgi:MFS family permease
LDATARAAAARRITLTLLAAQALGSGGFAVAATVNPIVAARLGGSPAWAGTATATYQAGAALIAFAWGLAMDRLGRRRTLALGIFVGALGAAVAWRAVLLQTLGAFLAGIAMMGMAQAALQLGRFVAAEVNPPHARGRAISNVVVGGTVGGVLGPFLVAPAGAVALRFGLDELSGAYAASAAVFAVVVACLVAGLRPEPAELARHVSVAHAPESSREAPARPLAQILSGRATRLAITALVLGQAVMVGVMVITAVHMKDHHHGLSGIAAVISSHIFGMYAFSVVSGRLADAWGRRPVILAGSAALLAACLAAPLSPRVLPLAAALFLLGLGWNFCYVAGSALLSDQLRPSERARTQGFNDTLIGVASAAGALASGFVFGAWGYAAVGLLSGAAALVPLVMALRPTEAGRATAPDVTSA